MPFRHVVSAAVVLGGCAAAPPDFLHAPPWLDVPAGIAAAEEAGPDTAAADAADVLSLPPDDAVAAAGATRPALWFQDLGTGEGAGPAPPGQASAQEAPPDDERGWSFSVTPYFWLFSLDVSRTTAGGAASGQADLGDVFDFIQSSADLALMGHLEASNGEWTVFGDAELLDFSGDGEVPFRGRTYDVEYDFSFRLAELGAARTLARFEGGGGRDGTLEVLGGARWIEREHEFDVGGRTVEGEPSSSWVDAFVGARVRLPVGGPFDLTVRGDAGGFGIGESSDVSWNFVAAVDVRISDGVSLLGGWRRYKYEREAHDADTELILSGPFVAVVLRF